MKYYQAYGLNIASAVSFPMVSESEKPEHVDVHIYKAWFPRPVRLFLRGKKGVIRKHEIGFALVQNGKNVFLYIQKDAPSEKLCMFLFGNCLRMIMRQRGHLFYLHGSCLVKDGKGVVLTGPSGAGKSTVAAALLKSGWQFMADDISYYRADKCNVQVISSCSLQKLWADAKDAYAEGRSSFYFMQDGSGKNKYYVDAGKSFFNGEVTLKMIVILEKGDRFSITNVSDSQKAVMIMQCLQPIPQPENTNYKIALQDSDTLAARVPLLHISRDDRADYSEKICKEIISRLCTQNAES